MPDMIATFLDKMLAEGVFAFFMKIRNLVANQSKGQPVAQQFSI